LAGFVGGGLGFGLGGVWIFVGESVGFETAPWWKLMEFTFGALFGAGLGWAAAGLKASGAPAPRPSGNWRIAMASLPLLIAVFWLEPYIPVRFSYAVVGSVLLLAAAAWPLLRLPVALTLTAVAFFADWAERHARDHVLGSDEFGWTLAVAASAAFAWAVSQVRSTRQAFWLIAGTAVAVAMAKGAITSLNAEHALFAMLTAALMLYPAEPRARARGPHPGGRRSVP